MKQKSKIHVNNGIAIRVYFVWIEYDKSRDFNTQPSMISRKRTIAALYTTTRLKFYTLPINNYSNTNFLIRISAKQSIVQFVWKHFFSLSIDHRVYSFEGRTYLDKFYSFICSGHSSFPFPNLLLFLRYRNNSSCSVFLFSPLFSSVARYNLWSLACIHWLRYVLSPPLTSTEYQLGPP